MSPEMAAKVIEAAKGWLLTPWQHMGSIKGVGVDCAMLLVEVYKEVGLLPQDLDPRPYDADWFLHRDEEKYLGWLKLYADKVEEPLPGDVSVYRFGRTAAHGAIVIDDTLIIHAYRPTGNVELCERRSLEHRFDSHWRIRT